MMSESARARKTRSAGPVLPPSFAHKRPRLSDEETERRMLQTAVDALSRTGLTVSLEHLRMEDVIREAGVSRSAVYRRWPSKDLFLGDLLLELAKASAPRNAVGSGEATALIRSLVLDRLDRLETADGRAHLVVEIVRQSAWLDFSHLYRAGEWRTYLALTTTFIGMPPGELRDQVQQALAASERSFTQRIAHSIESISRLLGMRLKHGSALSYETVAHLSNAVLRGVITKALATPELATEHAAGPLFDAEEDWSLAGLGLFAVLTTYLEPDPEVHWDRARIDQLRVFVASADDLLVE